MKLKILQQYYQTIPGNKVFDSGNLISFKIKKK